MRKVLALAAIHEPRFTDISHTGTHKSLGVEDMADRLGPNRNDENLRGSVGFFVQSGQELRIFLPIAAALASGNSVFISPSNPDWAALAEHIDKVGHAQAKTPVLLFVGNHTALQFHNATSLSISKGNDLMPSSRRLRRKPGRFRGSLSFRRRPCSC